MLTIISMIEIPTLERVCRVIVSRGRNIINVVSKGKNFTIARQWNGNVTKAHYIFNGPRNTNAFHGKLLFPDISRGLLPLLCSFAVQSLRPKLVGTAPRRFVYPRNAAIWNTLRFYQVKKHSIRRKRDEAARTKSRERVCARVAYFSRYVYAYGFQTVEKQKHNVNIRESSRRKKWQSRKNTSKLSRTNNFAIFKIPNYAYIPSSCRKLFTDRRFYAWTQFDSLLIRLIKPLKLLRILIV